MSFLLLGSSNWSTSWYGSKVCVLGSGPAEDQNGLQSLLKYVGRINKSVRVYGGDGIVTVIDDGNYSLNATVDM